jgi:hypothetical protein
MAVPSAGLPAARAAKKSPTSNNPSIRNTDKKRQRIGLVPDELGTLIDRDLNMLRNYGWEDLVSSRQARGDLADLDNLHHPARRLL